ncbi:MAG: protein phosphatase 2C domain-containing protein [Microscillaceae bacterium]|jgi:hypothetical protein|nr:protein phosphatase 2C domain-containing protein [Microscillaceae bacterium]
MQIYTLVRRGELHSVHCEDFLVSLDIDRNFYVGAVFDGCSSAVDSHFASALLGKILKKNCQTLPYQSFYQFGGSGLASADLGKWLLRQIFEDLQAARNQWLLDKLEMLATMILLVYHKTHKKAWAMALGDGVIKYDAQIYELDQNNRPDYVAYHLGEDFEEWFAQQTQVFELENPQDISICSDGIATFQSLKTDIAADFDPITYLLTDSFLAQHANMLTRKCNILQKQYGFLPADDVSIIRLRLAV